MIRGLSIHGAILAAVACGLGPSQLLADEDFYAPKVWGDLSGGQMNFSSFVFRDLNRNGIYDLGDRPMAKVAVTMSGERGLDRVQRSNLDGYANFEMSGTQPDKAIAVPGHHSFRVVPPPGWSITTGNAMQESDFVALPGAPGDIIGKTPMKPVGLAPNLAIRGSIDVAKFDGRPTVTASGPNGPEGVIDLAVDGSFDIPVSPGKWTIKIEGGNVGTIERMVDVVNVPVRLARIAPGDGDAPASSVSVADFDRLAAGQSVLKVPSAYASVGWSNFVAIQNQYYGGEGYVNGTVSGTHVVYNSSGHPVDLHSDRPFDFLGGYFSVAWLDAEGEVLHVKAWRGDTLLHQDDIPLSALGPVYFDARYTGLTRLEFATEHYWQFVGDDFRIGTR